MKELLKGIASFDHILTEEDALRYNGATLASDNAATSAVDDVPSDTVVSDAPAPTPDVTSPDVPPAETEEVQLTDEELAKKLESENNKDALIAMAETAGVDSTGVKAEIAARLVAHYRTQQ